MRVFSKRHKFPHREALEELLHSGTIVDTGHWQGLKNVPHTRTLELQYVAIETEIQPTVGSWASSCEPNLPWAEDHFQERVGGEPLNPGVQFENWPWFSPSWKAQDNPEAKFSHTYMERFWPKQAGDWPAGENDPPHHGIRYEWGDLSSLLDLLSSQPHTRQAYLPIWFPEDLTAACSGERVPCTLGYHFMLRDERLHCFYPMRSVDAVRYLQDDAYMAGRLVQWIIHKLRLMEEFWDDVLPGQLTMFCSSLHVFEDELPALRRKYASS